MDHVLFVALVVVPSFALVAFPDLSQTIESSWTFALYFARAWLLVLWISVRPPMVSPPTVRPLMLAEIALIGPVLEAPIAVWLERSLHADTDNILEIIVSVLLFVAYSQAGGVIEQDLTAAEQAAGRQQPFPAPGESAPKHPGWAQPYPQPWGAAQPWNPAAGWGSSGFTQLPGHYPQPGVSRPPGT